MRLFKTEKGNMLHVEENYYLIADDWDRLINRDGLYPYLISQLENYELMDAGLARKWIETLSLAPIGSQEVWAAGVTYFRSMEARKEESKESGGADLYDKVYHADRPELFFKALPHRVSGPKQPLNIRKDSVWNVPEPELTLFISSSGNIQGYTIGNDMSSRSIEGENALYLPQAKIYERSAGLGPCLYITDKPLNAQTTIEMKIMRNGIQQYQDSVQIDRIKRSFQELASYLYRECAFSSGSYLMTGTCLVPGNEFTLEVGDEVLISIDHIGTLINTISYKA